MSTFTLTICCLTAIHLIHGPNIPGSYAVLFFTADLLSPDTTTTGHHFHFGSAFSLFLEPFLHTSLQKHIRHLLTSWAHLSLSYVFSFHTIHGVLKARMLTWLAILFSRDCVLSELHPWPICFRWPYTAWLIVWVTQSCDSMWSFWLVFFDYGFHSVCPMMDED